jgi:ubiquinone/menaquinone biosynthesis C-methylase UbiE
MRLHRHHHGGPDGFTGRRVRWYDFMASRLIRSLYRRLARDVATLVPEGGAVLDVGTGPGVLLVELARRRPDLRVTGLDRSPDMVSAARRKLARLGPRASAVTGDAAELPFPDGSFDLVVSSLSLHHWDHPEQARPEFARVLRPGGRVCTYDFATAPFDALTTGGERAPMRSGIPFAPKLIRVLFTP